MSTKENEALTRRYTDEIWGKGDLKAIDEVFAPDYVDHFPFPGFTPDREGLKKSISTFRSAVPDMRTRVEDVITEGDKVVARWSSTGTHKGELMGIPPTNKKVTMSGITICRIAKGKIVEEWSQADFAGMMQQLGVGPQPGKQ
jgi:steroid delta-isomerase-like uncharacterized protein